MTAKVHGHKIVWITHSGNQRRGEAKLRIKRRAGGDEVTVV